jgi:hypothetical protein
MAKYKQGQEDKYLIKELIKQMQASGITSFFIADLYNAFGTRTSAYVFFGVTPRFFCYPLGAIVKRNLHQHQSKSN